eukprot:c41419_g1_i1 orf=2-187(-)
MHAHTHNILMLSFCHRLALMRKTKLVGRAYTPINIDEKELEQKIHKSECCISANKASHAQFF